MKRKFSLWCLIDLDDPFERILAIFDTEKELADYVGISQISLSSAMNHARKRGTRCRYAKIPMTEEEWRDCHEN